MLALALTVITAVAAVGLIASEVRVFRPGIWLCKPIASAGFVACALAVWIYGAREGFGSTGNSDGSANSWLLAALVACAIGDICLIPRSVAAFGAGVLFFTLGHVLYAVVFVLRGLDPLFAAGGTFILGVVAWRGFLVLRPGVPAGMAAPVGAYCGILTLMAALAVASTAATGDLRVAAGGLLFYVSDAFVGRERFLRTAVVNRVLALSLYYAAQLVFAWTMV